MTAMDCLLDTCTAIWFFEGSDDIPLRTRAMLSDPARRVYVSDVSMLEIVIKHRSGKFPLPAPPSRLLPVLIRKHGLDVLPIRTRDIFRVEALADFHRDPFDRLLIAQAIENKLTLVTPDPLIWRYPARCLWR